MQQGRVGSFEILLKEDKVGIKPALRWRLLQRLSQAGYGLVTARTAFLQLAENFLRFFSITMILIAIYDC
jgi:hypothetical protein